MTSDDSAETRAFWDRVAQDWDLQVGEAGDSNRILNSDPVLWEFAGNVAGLRVLDAGCGTGYLSRQLHARGADVIGIDFSPQMIAIAQAKAPAIDFRVDSCSELGSIGDGSIDIIISNYVLMDASDLIGTMHAFNRVLKADRIVILIFSHPCFPQGRLKTSPDESVLQYHWDFSYFEEQKCIDSAWGHFTSDFIWFHRPLSAYWKAFKAAGFTVVDFEEPRVTPERYHLAPNEAKLNNSKQRPYSVAFKLQKQGREERSDFSR